MILPQTFYNLSEDIVSDESLQNLLDGSWDSIAEAHIASDRYNRITEIRQQDTSIESISIYTYNEQLAGYGNFLPITEDLKETEWFQQAASTSAIFWRTAKREDTYGNTYWELNMVRQLTLPSSRSYAVLVVTASNNYLKNRIDNNALKNIITVNDDPAFFSTDRKYVGNPVPLELDTSQYSYTDSGVLSLDDSNTMASVNTLVPYKSDDRIYVISYNPQALGELRQIQSNYALILVFAILIPCLLMYLFIRYFSARVNTLRSAMHQASQGDYNIIDSFHGNDELSEAFQDLQMMIQEIKQKEALVYEARLKEQELENRQQQMEYKMLASQINPHFLYNTLETIRMKAFAAGNREVAMAIKLLGKSLRYVLDNTGTVSTTLAKEIDYLRIYFSIQQLRFGDRINYTVNIQDGLDLENYQILPLLLQPIVENAVSHGLENVDENGQILLNIYEENVHLSLHRHFRQRRRNDGKGTGRSPQKHFRKRTPAGRRVSAFTISIREFSYVMGRNTPSLSPVRRERVPPSVSGFR